MYAYYYYHDMASGFLNKFCNILSGDSNSVLKVLLGLRPNQHHCYWSLAIATYNKQVIYIFLFICAYLVLKQVYLYKTYIFLIELYLLVYKKTTSHIPV